MGNDKKLKCPIKFLKYLQDSDCKEARYWQDSYGNKDEYCQDDCAWCVNIVLDGTTKNVCAVALSSITSINPSMKLYDAEERL